MFRICIKKARRIIWNVLFAAALLAILDLITYLVIDPDPGRTVIISHTLGVVTTPRLLFNILTQSFTINILLVSAVYLVTYAYFSIIE